MDQVIGTQPPTAAEVTRPGRAVRLDSDGALAAAKAGGSTGDVIWTDRHTDVAATFAPNATSLTGTHTYDPLGTTLTDSGDTTTLALGYQANYTDQTTGHVYMNARWYSPTTGQFTRQDDMDTTDSINAAGPEPPRLRGRRPYSQYRPHRKCDLLLMGVNITRFHISGIGYQGTVRCRPGTYTPPRPWGTQLKYKCK